MNTLIGTTIAQYRILDRLGRGGMGTVYRALDTGLERPVALKVMHDQFADEPSFQQRFAQEARAAARLDHPSIVKVFGYGRFQDTAYIAMEYVAGGSLSHYLRLAAAKGRVLPLNEALPLLAQIADALAYAHRRDVIHRDIKPDNILLKPLDQPDRPGDPPIRAVLTDFGLVKLAAGGVQTQTGTFLGSLSYMSPEHVLDRPVDGRSDIYSLGVVTYQLLTGRLPRNLTTPTEAVMAHMQGAPPSLEEIHAALPPLLAGIVGRALAPQPDARYQSAAEMAHALRAARDAAPDPAASAAVDQTLAMPDAPQETLAQQVASTTTRRRRETAAMTQKPPAVDKTALDQPPDVTALEPPPVDKTALDQPPIDLGRSADVDWTAVTPKRDPAPAPPPRPRPPEEAPPTRLIADDGPAVTLRLQPARQTVMPGGNVHYELTVLNSGRRPVELTWRVTDLPPTWVTVTPPTLSLAPGRTQVAAVRVAPPADGSAAPGVINWKLLAVVESAQAAVARAQATLSVQSYERFAVAPLRDVRVGRPAAVHVRNEGNVPLRVSLAARDRVGEVFFAIEPPTLEVPPGESRAATMTARAQSRPLVGRSTSYGFDLMATGGGGRRLTQAAEIAVPPRLGALWLSLIAVVLLLGCGATVYTFRDAIFPPGVVAEATDTPPAATATPTEAGGIVLPTEPPTESPTAIVPTATPGPTDTPAPTPTPTVAPTPIPQVRPDVSAFQLTTPPTIDGDLSDWPPLQGYRSAFVVYAQNAAAPTDIDAVWRLGWDANNLYVAVTVRDDVHVQQQTGNQIWQGDSLDMQIDTQRAADSGNTRVSPDDYQFVLSPGDFAGLPPSAWRFNATADGAFINDLGNSVALAAVRQPNGYTLEAAIPWTDMAFAPTAGATLGVSLNVNDKDATNAALGTTGQQTMKSHVETRTLTNPTTWGTMTLQ